MEVIIKQFMDKK